mmetsp:Transcript_7829/g.12062  ORF Transcript_7829/g.12062 Transcript_7829/m.12062 type:complete len:216 (+) Transcript_7829:64-711(+)
MIMNCESLLKGNQELVDPKPLIKNNSDREVTSCASTDDSTVDSGPAKKLVQFHEEANTVIGKSPSHKELWYSVSDLKSFRAEAEREGLSVRKKSSSSYLETAFSVCPRSKKQEALNSWATKNYRGLEEYVNTQYASSRHELQKMLWAAVLEAQALKANPHEICEVSQQLTRSARSMAEVMGQADLLACTAPSKNPLKATILKRNWSLGNPKNQSR